LLGTWIAARGAPWRAGRRNPHVTAGHADSRLIDVGPPHQSGQLDHRPFMRFDLREDLLRPLESKLPAFLELGAAQLVFRTSRDGEHAAAGATGD